MLREKLQIHTRIQESFKIGKDANAVILVKMQDWEGKMEIMKTKNKLKGTKLVIENDLTRLEMNIQFKLKPEAEKRKEYGDQVRIGYQTLVVNAEVYRWKVEEGKLVKAEEKQDI